MDVPKYEKIGMELQNLLLSHPEFEEKIDIVTKGPILSEIVIKTKKDGVWIFDTLDHQGQLRKVSERIGVIAEEELNSLVIYRVKKLLRVKDIPYRALAAHLNVEVSTVSHWMNNSRRLSFYTICRIADFLNVPVTKLISL